HHHLSQTPSSDNAFDPHQASRPANTFSNLRCHLQRVVCRFHASETHEHAKSNLVSQRYSPDAFLPANQQQAANMTRPHHDRSPSSELLYSQPYPSMYSHDIQGG